MMVDLGGCMENVWVDLLCSTTPDQLEILLLRRNLDCRGKCQCRAVLLCLQIHWCVIPLFVSKCSLQFLLSSNELSTGATTPSVPFTVSVAVQALLDRVTLERAFLGNWGVGVFLRRRIPSSCRQSAISLLSEVGERCPVCVCVCEREREREGGGGRTGFFEKLSGRRQNNQMDLLKQCNEQSVSHHHHSGISNELFDFVCTCRKFQQYSSVQGWIRVWYSQKDVFGILKSENWSSSTTGALPLLIMSFTTLSSNTPCMDAHPPLVFVKFLAVASLTLVGEVECCKEIVLKSGPTKKQKTNHFEEKLVCEAVIVYRFRSISSWRTKWKFVKQRRSGVVTCCFSPCGRTALVISLIVENGVANIGNNQVILVWQTSISEPNAFCCKDLALKRLRAYTHHFGRKFVELNWQLTDGLIVDVLSDND